MATHDIRLPDNCRVRLVDLPLCADGALSVDAEGYVNIYVNARLPAEARRRALMHELRHHARGDLYSDADIRAVERSAEPLTAVDGAPLTPPLPVYDADGLRRVGRGLYLPQGRNLAKATAHIARARALLLEACRAFDVMQTPPLLPVRRLYAPAEALCAEDIAFVAWQSAGERCRVALHFSREELYGAMYFAADGAPDNLLAVLMPDGPRVTVDARRTARGLALYAVTRETEGGFERVY